MRRIVAKRKERLVENSRSGSEAAVVVEAVLDRMSEYPKAPLGVVTMNAEQKDLMEELLDRRLRDDPVAVAIKSK